MAYEQKPNSGALFANDRQRPDKQDPNAQGKLLLGEELIEALYNKGGDQIVYLSAWTREPKEEGKKRWQSLSVSLPREKAKAESVGADDDIPF